MYFLPLTLEGTERFSSPENQHIPRKSRVFSDHEILLIQIRNAWRNFCILQVAAPQDVDDDGSGTIGYEEFLKMMTHKILNRDPKDATWTGLKTEIPSLKLL